MGSNNSRLSIQMQEFWCCNVRITSSSMEVGKFFCIFRVQKSSRRLRAWAPASAIGTFEDLDSTSCNDHGKLKEELDTLYRQHFRIFHYGEKEVSRPQARGMLQPFPFSLCPNSAGDLTLSQEISCNMEQIQPLQPQPAENPFQFRNDLLPAKVELEIPHEGLPWRDDPREAMAANVYTTFELRYTYGS